MVILNIALIVVQKWMGCQMANLKIGNKLITASLYDILNQIKKETNGYLNTIQVHNDEIMFTCPFHKEGNESHPSCSIHDNAEDSQHGIFHCFTCGASGTIFDLIAHCFNEDIIFANDWLEDRFSSLFVVKQDVLPEIVLDKDKPKYLDESILTEYSYFHPYMFERGLTEETIKKFRLGCTPDGEFITFPCWDEHNNLLGIFKRSTKGKQFIIPKGIDKPIYLLNYVLNEKSNKVIVCEGNFDALMAWQYGFPAVALFGAGTPRAQVERLNSCGILNFILMYDNDEAGRKGANRFKNFIGEDKLVTDIIMPKGKDIASCTYDEFWNILHSYDIS